ncbi:MAG: O-antigen ligase family protein [bacterium]|nr:O-antigen ligase family protein [bacterium]
MRKRGDKFFENGIFWLYLLIIFIVPLIFLVPVNSVDLTKIGIQRSFLSGILILWVLSLNKNRSYPFVHSPLNLPLIILFLLAILSTIFSVRPYTSLIGTYNRYQGLFTITCYILLFFITQILVKKRKDAVSWIIDTVLFSNLFAMLYGFIQRLGRDPYQWSGGAWTRIHSTFGNPVFYAAWLSMVLPIALFMYLTEERPRRRLWYAVSFLLCYLSFLFANTRATFVGYFFASWLFSLFLVGFRFSILYYGGVSIIFGIASFLIVKFLSANNPLGLGIGGLFFGLLFFGPLIGLLIRENPLYQRLEAKLKVLWSFFDRIISEQGIAPSTFKRKKGLVTITIIGILMTIACNIDPSSSTARRFYNEMLDRMPKKDVLPVVEIMENVEDKAADPFGGSAKIRIMMWKACAKIAKDYPLFGIGPDTLGMVYPKYRDVSFVRTYSEHSGTNRAHNEVLDMAVNFGIPGMILYYAIFVILFVIGIRFMKSSSVKEKILIASLLSLQVAYIVQNQMSFGATTITSLSFLGLGIIGGIAGRLKEVSVQKKEAFWMVSVVFIIFSVISVGLLIPAFIADVSFRTGRVYEESKYPDIASQYYKKAIFWCPFEESYYQPLVKIRLMGGRIEEKDEAIRLIRQALRYAEPSASLWHSLGTGYYLKGGENATKLAVWAYKKAIEMDPLYGPSYHYIGVILKDERRLEEASNYLEKAVNFRPDNPEYLETLGYLYMDRGKEKEAKACWERMIEIPKEYTGTNVNLKDVRIRLSLIYYHLKMWDECIIQCQEVLKLAPNDISTRNNLATIYYGKGELAKAANECKRSLQYDPGNIYARQMLGAMGYTPK